MATTIIESKYTIGDVVWVMCNDKACEAVIKDLTVEADYGDQKRPLSERVKWVLNKTERRTMHSMNMDGPLTRHEKDLFSSKKELIESL